MSKIPVAAYIRTMDDNHDFYSKADQRASILDYADNNGYVIEKWYEDIYCSDDKRPLLESFIFNNDNYEKPFDTLILYNHEIISPNDTLFFSYLFQLVRKNITVLSVQNDISSDEPSWVAQMSLIKLIAQQEKEYRSLFTISGKQIKAQTGSYVGGRPPYGYSIDKGCLVINEDEAKVVRMIFEWFNQGLGLRAVATNLNKLGIKTKAGNDFTYSSIRSIRDNMKVYQGYYKHGDMEWTTGQHLPIINETEPVADDYNITILDYDDSDEYQIIIE